MLRQVLFAVMIFATVRTAMGAMVTLADLPSSIQQCVLSSGCVVNLDSRFDASGVSVFDYYSYSSETRENLVRYSLASPSAEVGTSLAGPRTGFIWLQVAQSYNSNENRHYFSLYTDYVTPLVSNFWTADSSPTTLNFSVSSQALLRGTSYYEARIDSSTVEGELRTHVDDDPWESPGLLPCATDGCSVGAEFNFAMLNYKQAGDQYEFYFDPNDTQRMLFSQYHRLDVSLFDRMGGLNDFLLQQTYFVKPVPLPAAILLLGSSLFGLFVFRVRRGPTALDNGVLTEGDAITDSTPKVGATKRSMRSTHNEDDRSAKTMVKNTSRLLASDVNNDSLYVIRTRLLFHFVFQHCAESYSSSTNVASSPPVQSSG